MAARNSRKKPANSKKKKKKTKSRKQRNKRASKRKTWLRAVAGLAGVGLVALLIYTLYLDFRITRSFEGGHWDVPAQVFARPLEIYVGQNLSALQLKEELLALGYQRDGTASLPGTFAVGRDSLIVTTRGFKFFDGWQDPTSLRVNFGENYIASIEDRGSGANVPLARLDPLLIGSLLPGGGEDRVLLTPSEIPELLTASLLAVEDRSFFSHHGLDPRGIARAFFVNVTSGELKQGGSTLTQQLVKSYYLDNRRTFVRKFNEAIMALLLEIRYSKEELLTAYINEIFLGQDGSRAIHGFGLASHFYFNKPVRELDGHEIALLVGMVKGPSLYDPRRNPERAKNRRDLVIDQMQAQNLVESSRAGEWKTHELRLADGESNRGYFPAYLGLVRQQLKREYQESDLTKAGLRVFTAFDPMVQRQAETSLTEYLSRHEDDNLDGAVVATTVDGAEVIAVVGGKRVAFHGFNRALEAKRPVGSLVKPAVYLAAFESERYHLLSEVVDEAIVVDLSNTTQWSPSNYDQEYVGEISILRALAESRNIPSVRVGLDVGIDSVVTVLRRLGVVGEINQYPSLLLGSLELTPLQVAQMYNTLGNGGFLTPLKAVRAVSDSTGEPLGRYPLQVRQTVQSAPLHQLLQGMVAVMQRGTGANSQSRLPKSVAVAGKTGTTDELRDSWFAGFSGNYVGVVWLGRDDNESTGLTGAAGALQVWADLMAGLPNHGLLLDSPDGFTPSWVSYESNRMTGETCSDSWPVSLPDSTRLPPPAPCLEKPRVGRRALSWIKGLFVE
ncbi:MAG: penicillin-binding protein 1B [Pseudomonadota bacterium]